MCRAVVVGKGRKMSTWKKILISLIILLFLLTAGAYGYGVYYFTSHFLPGSMVNGFNCSYMTVEESEKLLDELMTLENPYHCPHGRPTIISMTKTEMEKKFKRIV